MTVALGLVTVGQPRWECTWALVKAARECAFDAFNICPTGPYVDDGRNALVRWFLDETDCDRFLSFDDDMSFLPADIAQLEADELDCVSGTYYNVFDGVLKPVVRLLEKEGGQTVVESDDPLVEVAGVGAGFLMVTRELLEKMRAEYPEPCPWFYEPVLEGEHYGEDIGFCHRVRELGAKVFVDLRVQLNHHKTVRITGPGGFEVPRAGRGR